MKTHQILALVLALTASASINSNKASAQEVSISIQVFYDELSPYGQWVEYPNVPVLNSYQRKKVYI